MRNAIAAAAIAIAAIAIAQEQAKPAAKHRFSPGEFEARAKQNYVRRTGGTVRKPGSAKGKALVISAQDRVGRAAIGSAVGHIDETIHPILEYVEMRDVRFSNPGEDIRRLGGKVGVVIVDVDGVPALLTAPEEARAHILRCAAHQFESGDAQHWWHPPRAGVRTRVSDSAFVR